ncbi:hypothetical protein ADL02_24835 [Streptomyces sp. NRRL WC-3723]|nr:hypothetical protein ADL02_24835 [Streptomyces sp. NRRL WC-3723]
MLLQLIEGTADRIAAFRPLLDQQLDRHAVAIAVAEELDKKAACAAAESRVTDGLVEDLGEILA